MLDRIDRTIGVLCQIVSGVAFCFMALIAFVDSIGRMFDNPLLGASEYVEFALLIFFASSLAFVVRDDANIKIGLFADLYKPRLTRIEGFLTNVGELLALIALSYMLYDQAARLARFSTLSAFFKIPMAPWIFLAAALTLTAVWFALRKFLRSRAEPVPRPHAIPDEEAE